MAEQRHSRPEPATKSPTVPPTFLDLSNPGTIRQWLALVESNIGDAIGAAEDQLLPLDKRNLGRVQARRILGDARGALDGLLALMRASLPE